MNEVSSMNEDVPGDVFDVQSNRLGVLQEKLQDAEVPGFVAEFDPAEAERVGAFEETAMTETDAAESDLDLIDAVYVQEAK